MKNKLFIVFSSIIVSFSLSSCGNLPTSSKCKVTFNPNYDGKESTVIEVNKGEKINKPSDPIRDGYTFKGWKDSNYVTAKDFDFNTSITCDITLYGNWEFNSYVVTFDPNYDNQPVNKVGVAPGDKVVEPNKPFRDGYIFNGWRIANTIKSEKFNFDTKINSNITLYGSWVSIASTPIEKMPNVYYVFNNGNVGDLGSNIKTYFFNDSDVAYFSIEEGVREYINSAHEIYPTTVGEYTFVNDNFVTTITNTMNNSTCLIDYKKQTFTFPDYNAFLANEYTQLTPFDVGISSMRNYFVEINKISYDAPKEPLVIDFKHYNIPIYYYNDEGYLPLQIFNNLLCRFSVTEYTYAGGNMFLSSAEGRNQLIANAIIKQELGFNGFSKNYLEYCLNLQAITLDNRYGMKERKSRYCEGNVIKYSKDAYKVLNVYKDKLLSTDPNVASIALSEAINLMYDDGGHTAYFTHGLNDNKAFNFYKGNEYNMTFKALNALTQKRKEKGLDPDTKMSTSALGYYEPLNYQDNDTAFLTFDGFENKGTIPTYDQVDATNYYSSVVGLTRYTDKMLRTSGTNIKKLVIDLSVNTGGLIGCGYYIASWLCGGVTSTLGNLNNGAISKVSYKADINGDGKFDDKDVLPTTVENVYVIISPSSFSCGNFLPTTLKDYCSKARFIGTPSGGGACSVLSGMQTGYGNSYQMSSTSTFVLKNSTKDDLISNDDGVNQIDYPFDYPYTEAATENYYNRNAIYDLIHQ